MIVQSIPFPSAAAGLTSSPDYGTVEQVGTVTTAASPLAGPVFNGFTGKANRDYLFLWSQDVSGDNTASYIGADVKVGGSSIFATNPQMAAYRPSGPADVMAMGGLFKFSAGAAPLATDIALNAIHGTNAIDLTLKNARLSYVILGADDHYAEALPRQAFLSPANKTPTAVASLTFTPATAGDYVVLCSFNFDLVNSTNVDFAATLSDGTTAVGGARWRPYSASNADRCPGMLVLPLTAVSGATTITLSISQPNSGGATIGVSEIRMVALRLDRFANVYKTQLAVNSDGTDAAYVNALAQTFTPAAADHLTVATWAQATTSLSASSYGQYLDGAVSVNEMVKGFGEARDYGLVGVSHRIANYAAAPLTQAIQRKASATVDNVIEAWATIVTLDLTGI